MTQLDNDDEISFIPMENIDENYGAVDVLLTKKKIEIKGYVKFQDDDLLWAKITPCMQNGKSAVAENLLNGIGCGSTEFYVIRPKSDEILVKYIHFILRDYRVLKNAENFFGGSSGHQRVSKSYIENLIIPIPDIETQQEIISIMDNAYIQKKQKEDEAEKLLGSVDDYLLDKLGIKMPQEKENTLDNRKFYVSSSKVIGNRFDPKIYDKYYNNIEYALNNCKHNIEKLGTISQKIFQGINIVKNDEEENIVLKVKNIRKYEVVYDDYAEYTEINNLSKALYDFDIITPFIGEAIKKYKFAMFEKNDINKNYFVDGNVGVIRLKEDVDFNYICYYLNSKLTSIQIEKLIGGGMPFLGAHNAKDILIVVPKLEIQNEISLEISRILQKVTLLKQEAEIVLQKAKNHVENILLGGEILCD